MEKKIGSFLKSIIIVSALSLKSVFAQGEAVITFLGSQQSPQFLGAAQVGVAVPPIDPIGFYLNPAVLGETSKEFNVTTMFMPSKANWAGLDHVKFNTFGMSLGYNFENSLLNIPLSVGIGFISGKFDYGTFAVTGPESPEPLFTTETYDKFNQFSIGATYSFYLDISAGIAFKNFESTIGGNIINGEKIIYESDGTAIDYGFLLTVPISKLFYNHLGFPLKDNFIVKPKTSLSLGYSVTNIGDEIEYSFLEYQKGPIPRTARLGYNINLGFDLVSDEFKMNLFDYYFIVDAEDLLVERKEENNSETEYQSGLGDISFGKQLIQLKGTDEVALRKAHIFRFLETVNISVGRVDGRGYLSRESDGFMVSTMGLSKYLAANFDNEIIQFIAKHIAVEYYKTTLFSGVYETKIEGVGLILKNFSF